MVQTYRFQTAAFPSVVLSCMMPVPFPFTHPPLPCPNACMPVCVHTVGVEIPFKIGTMIEVPRGALQVGWVGEAGTRGGSWKEVWGRDGGAPRWPAARWEVGGRPVPIDNNTSMGKGGSPVFPVCVNQQLLASGKLLSTQTRNTELHTSASRGVIHSTSWTSFRNSAMP